MSTLTNLQLELKTLKDKSDLQNKKIKLYRKENEEYKHELVRQAQIDATLLLNSKELSQANTKLENAIHDITLKLHKSFDSIGTNAQNRIVQPDSLVTIKSIIVNEETQEVDLPNEEIGDQEIGQLKPFKRIKSLMLGQNKIKNEGIITITSYLTNLVRLQINANCFEADSLREIHNLTNLRILDIRNNNLGDSCMPYLKTLAHLTELSISKNSITDQGLAVIIGLTQLVYFDATTNLITDQGTTNLFHFKKLTHLYLMFNRITQDAVYKLFEILCRLEVLDVRFNINDTAKKEALRERKPQKLQLFC